MVAGLFGAANLCKAAPITWEDTDSGSPLDFLEEKWGSYDNSYDLSYSGTWNILNAGFNPASDTIDAITVWFAFADDSPGNFEGAETSNGGDAPEYVDISLGGTKIWDDLEVDGRHPASTYTYYSMVLNPLSHFTVFNDLATDGKLGYSVVIQDLFADTGSQSLNLEDTYLKVAKIQACSTPTPKSVPDGGSTFLAFGAGLIGLGGVRRFLIKA
jgi:hypothetical protein